MADISLRNISKGWNNSFAIKDLSLDIHDPQNTYRALPQYRH